MTNQKLHIISFDVPYPPDYGGVIDVFYKIKALYEVGVKIILHIFHYGREKAKELEEITEKVYYYKRKKDFKYNISTKPFIVATSSKAFFNESLIFGCNAS